MISSISDKNVLYFDDQQDKVEGIVEFLRGELDLTVETAENSAQACSLLKDNVFDLLVLDIRIEGETAANNIDWTRYGVWFLEKLRNGEIPGKTPNSVPVLVLTCVVDSEDIERIGKLGESRHGRYRYLSKPVNLDDVETAVKNLLSNKIVEAS